jgi:SAM-dependent methyltransferase
MEPLYKQDLAYIHAAAFGGLARGAATEIIRLLKAATIPIHKIGDVGCGAGVLTSALFEHGFEVAGIDSSAELVAIARTAVPGARFVNASLYDEEIPACEAIIALGEPLTYHGEGADADRLVQSFFQRASDKLPIGGCSSSM